MSAETMRLLVSCPDRPGLIAAVAGFIAEQGGNIVEADQHTDPEHGEFSMRVEVEHDRFRLTPKTFEAAWTPIAKQYEMRWHVHWGHEIKRMAILVSKAGHCLNDLLWRWKTGELNVEIPFVAGNHADLREVVESCGLTFHHLPVSDSDKYRQEERIRESLDQHRVDFVVLARYMQILSPDFVAAYPDRIINIHHSFLPAFAGGKPYHQAYNRGVKLIGATSHYVTADLDEGPIIAQQTMHVDHHDTVASLTRKGGDLERIVLAEAVRLHAEDKILVTQNKTVVFD